MIIDNVELTDKELSNLNSELGYLLYLSMMKKHRNPKLEKQLNIVSEFSIGGITRMAICNFEFDEFMRIENRTISFENSTANEENRAGNRFS